MKLIVISSPKEIPDEAIYINLLFELGMQRFHLRKPGWEEIDIEQLLNRIYPEFREQIVIHDYFQLAEKYELGGIHYTERTKSEMNNWEHLSGTKSISCHSIEELNELPNGIDYAFLSPIFPSISKEGYAGNFNLDELKTFLSSYTKTKVIALGGIEPSNIPSCKEMGFAGGAVLGSIWINDNTAATIQNQFSKLVEVCQN